MKTTSPVIITVVGGQHYHYILFFIDIPPHEMENEFHSKVYYLHGTDDGKPSEKPHGASNC